MQLRHSLLQLEGGHALPLNFFVEVVVDLVESTRETLVVGILQVNVHVSLGDRDLGNTSSHQTSSDHTDLLGGALGGTEPEMVVVE